MTARIDYLTAVIEQPAAAPRPPALVQNAGGCRLRLGCRSKDTHCSPIPVLGRGAV